MKDARTIANTPVEEIRRIVQENQTRIDLYKKRQVEKACPVCEEIFIAGRKDQIFCAPRCRAIWFKLKTELEKERQFNLAQLKD